MCFIDVYVCMYMHVCAFSLKFFVMDILHFLFFLCSNSKLNTFFHWECVSPFLLSPEQGHLKPEQEQYITVAFHPQEALVYQQPVSCKFGTEADQLESCCSVLLQGLGTSESS